MTIRYYAFWDDGAGRTLIVPEAEIDRLLTALRMDVLPPHQVYTDPNIIACLRNPYWLDDRVEVPPFDEFGHTPLNVDQSFEERTAYRRQAREDRWASRTMSWLAVGIILACILVGVLLSIR